jgi:predicted aconitase with swiveling domain
VDRVRKRSFSGLVVAAGSAQGEALAADVPLSFWGGFDPDTGVIIDQRHPLVGHNAAGRVLVLPSGRGSCSGSGVLLEAIRNGTAPAAILTSHLDPIIGLGCILGDELYASYPPMIVISERDRRKIASGDLIAVEEHGAITTTSTRVAVGHSMALAANKRPTR